MITLFLPPLSLSLSLSKCRLSGLSIRWSGMVYVCVCVNSACLHTQTTACFPGDTQLRVLGGWQRDGRRGRWGDGRGWHVQLGLGGEVGVGGGFEGWSNERCCGRGAVEGVAAKRGQARRVAWQWGLLVSRSPLSLLVPFLRTASAACFTCKTHPAERASTHGAKGRRRKAFLRLCWEKREVGIFNSLTLPVSLPDEAVGGCSN